MNTARYLDVADSLLRDRSEATAGCWPRACACLLRLGFERAVNDLWEREHPPVALVRSMRARLLSLHHVDRFAPDLPGRAEYLWAALSRAVHHHPYELSPTAAELRGWHRDVWSLALDLGSLPPVSEPAKPATPTPS